MRTSERGFSYLLLLFLVLLSGVALAALGENVTVGVQREREAELLWRGTEIARALARYHAVPVSGASRYPATLEELVEDRRLADPRYHLRRLYLDPYTGRADWVLLRDEQGGIVGIHSRASAVALARVDVPSVDSGGTAPSNDPARRRVDQWHFMADANASASVSAPAAASAPAAGAQPPPLRGPRPSPTQVPARSPS
jgi:type II secretory pathway pseudopilin PulG